MTTPQERRLIIEQAEQIVGSVLPDDVRESLIEHGIYELDMPEGGPDYFGLSETAQGSTIFEGDRGEDLTQSGWEDYAENIHLAEGAFWIAENGMGDIFLLSPDAEGVARQLVFCDHEVGEMYVVMPDIERPWKKPVRLIPLDGAYGQDAEKEHDGVLLWEVEQEEEIAPPPIPVAPAPSAYPALVFALCAAGTVTVVPKASSFSRRLFLSHFLRSLRLQLSACFSLFGCLGGI